jgi:hypothetical protein
MNAWATLCPLARSSEKSIARLWSMSAEMAVECAGSF